MTTGRPSRAAIAAELAALAAAVIVSVLRLPWANWDLALLGTLLALSILSDLFRIELPVRELVVSASFLTIVTAAVFLGSCRRH